MRKYTIRFGKAPKRSDIPHREGTGKSHPAADSRLTAKSRHAAGPQHHANPRYAADMQHCASPRYSAGSQDAARSRQIVLSRAAANQRHDEKSVFARAALLALCGSIVCVSFLAYSVAPREQPVVQVMARPVGEGSGDSAIPAISGNNDGSEWSYIENVIRGIIDDAGD